ncbi:MAG: DUF362 domain-containing protein [Sedimentisphaerales bacterium]|nr:DUF362 domain-containing protein [Sedimentisphaerales bacterium]
MAHAAKKHSSDNCHPANNKHFSHNDSRQCKKDGRLRAWSNKHPYLIWLLPLIGLVSLIWFLIRVIPKPSRATYPCQRLAAPLAGSFIVWIAGLVGSSFLYRRAKLLLKKSRYVMAGILIVFAVVVIWSVLSITGSHPANAAFSPSEPVNSPMGVAKGVHPGRVVWIRDPDATSWDQKSGNWWDDGNTDQSKVDGMISKSIRRLAGQSSDSMAWDALFRHFNKTKGSGEAGYKKGEKIVVKVNSNQDRSEIWRSGAGVHSPQVVYSLMVQLIVNAGVSGEDITIYDATSGRNIGNPIFNKIRGNPDKNFQAIKFVAGIQPPPEGRTAPVVDQDNPIRFAQPGLPTAFLPKCVTGAKYMINLALLRPHGMCGITLTAKNHYGSTYFQNNGWTPRPLHRSSSARNPMGTYNNLVDLTGHKHLGGKTVLYMIDGLYTAIDNEGQVFRFESLGNDWASSILVSQDPVAIDSVGLDILRSEPRATRVTGNPDNYLHEAAMANDPPSGTKYDPEGDGTILESLGVHEHWNNPKDRKYSRNLGTGDGIEIISMN